MDTLRVRDIWTYSHELRLVRASRSGVQRWCTDANLSLLPPELEVST
jgi:hypothetical protein